MTRNERIAEIYESQKKLENQLEALKEEERLEQEAEQKRQDEVVLKHIKFFEEFFDTHIGRGRCRNSDQDVPSDSSCPRCQVLCAIKYGYIEFKVNINLLDKFSKGE